MRIFEIFFLFYTQSMLRRGCFGVFLEECKEQGCGKEFIVFVSVWSKKKKIMKSSYLTKVPGKSKAMALEEHVGAFSDYFIFIVFPLQGLEYVMCIMLALSVAL